MTGSGIAAGLAALIALRIAQPIRFGIQKRVQRLLHRAPDHPIQVILDPLVVNRNDIAQRTRCILGHGGSFLLTWLRLATSSSARFGAASPTQLCERNRTSSRLLRSLGYAVEAYASATDLLASPRLVETACLITDVHMPAMTGVELYRHIIDTGR